MKIAINLLNYKSFQMGGVESFAKDLLEYFLRYRSEDIKFTYLITRAAFPRFEDLLGSQGFEGRVFDLNPDNFLYRTIFQKTKMKKILASEGVDLVFTPQPYMPFNPTNMNSVSVFHDFQHRDMPGNFSILQRLWRGYNDKTTLNNTEVAVTISEFTAKKLREIFQYDGKVEVISNSVKVITDIKDEKQSEVLDRYSVSENKFFYTISSSARHKNLSTLAELFKRKRNARFLVTGPSRSEHEKLVGSKPDNVQFTGYIDELDKNILLKNCKTFLFPSLYEGFGRPPIEALMHGKPVVTTKKTAIPETTLGYAHYVSKPQKVESWYEALEKDYSAPSAEQVRELRRTYDGKTVSEQYIDLFKTLV